MKNAHVHSNQSVLLLVLSFPESIQLYTWFIVYFLLAFPAENKGLRLVTFYNSMNVL